MNGVATNHYWDGSNIVRETGANNAIYYRGINIIAQRTVLGAAASATGSGEISYYVYNAHGDTMGLVNTSGNITRSIITMHLETVC